MNNEPGGKNMTKFVALRAKSYAYSKLDKNLQDNHSKGIKKCVVAESVTFENYKTCLFDGKIVFREQVLCEKKKHKTYLVIKHMTALNRDDDKRLVKGDGITTLAKGYIAQKNDHRHFYNF